MNAQNDFSSKQKENSKALLRELLMDNLLRSAPDTASSEDFRLPSGTDLPAPFPVPDESVSTGQIRLLPQIAFPTYIAVLDAWDGSSFLIVPFSRFSKPATEEELTTSRDGGTFLNVLQIWNARTAMEATLRKSWLVGTLPEQDVKDALLLWKWSIGDVAELPERISERTGVPIYRTDDPRLEYRREALENFAAFDAEDDANAEREENEVPDMSVSEDFWARMRKLGFVCRIAEKGPMRAAAASVSSANPRKTFFVEGVPAKLRVEYSPSAKTLLFSAWDKERRVKTAVLDGFELVVETRSDPVPVRDKGARVPVPEPSAEFVLRNPEGWFVKLAEER